MSSDAGAPSDRSRRDLRMEGHSADRSTKSLGRGLKDVSHFFLSATRETAAHAQAEDPAPSQAAGRSATRAGIAVLRPSAAIAKDQLTATLLECQDALENGMRALGAGVSCSPYGEIDLLALDRLNQLTVIDVETTPGDELLLRGISHVDWVARNLPNVRRMYHEWMIDCSQQPRLVLVAPRFSPIQRGAIRQLTHPTVTCFRYHTVEIFGGTGIVVERDRAEYD